MSGTQKTRLVAIGFVAVSAITITLLLFKTGDSKLITRILRFVLTCVMAWMLVRRAVWVRWVAGVLSVIAAVLVGLPALFTVSDFLSVTSIWMVLMTAFYAWAAYMLLLDKDVSRHFGSGNGL